MSLGLGLVNDRLRRACRSVSSRMVMITHMLLDFERVRDPSGMYHDCRYWVVG